MPSTTTKVFPWLVLHMGNDAGGWSEKYALKTAAGNGQEYGPAKLVGADIVAARAKILATDVSILWARVSFNGLEKEGKSVLDNGPISGAADPHGVQGADMLCNNLGAAAHFREECTDGGKWGNRLLRGIPDSLVNSNKKTDVPAWVSLAANVPLIANPAVFADDVKNFLTTIQRNCYVAKANYIGPKNKRRIDTYTLFEMEKILFRKIGQKKVGRPFGLSRGRR